VFEPGIAWIAALNVFVYVVYLRVYCCASFALWMFSLVL
jgi:hypothetical protein